MVIYLDELIDLCLSPSELLVDKGQEAAVWHFLTQALQFMADVTPRLQRVFGTDADAINTTAHLHLIFPAQCRIGKQVNRRAREIL
ncbi:hypothetical protein HGG76_11870 [Ochrobactrum tritici]|uniref:Uncharacterized protein n=1 Tax=Brucella tritici TaxID=94626 RepID=A0A7X6FRY4_9HYPH|nr:hypothetical protein [Brucella tritici]